MIPWTFSIHFDHCGLVLWDNFAPVTFLFLLIASPFAKSLATDGLFHELSAPRQVLFLIMAVLELLCAFPAIGMVQSKNPLEYSLMLFAICCLASVAFVPLYAVVMGFSRARRNSDYRNALIPLLPGLLCWTFWLKYLPGLYGSAVCDLGGP